MATDGHGGEFVPAGPTHDLAYEPDKFAVKTILVVPGVVIATMAVAFIITNVIFGAFFAPKKFEPQPASEAGAVANAAQMNDRFDRISSTNPKADVLQPRLEGIQKRQVYGGGDDKKVTPEMISTQPSKDGNSPRYHAEDLRPDRVPATAKPAPDPQTGAARLPVGRVIELAGDPTNAAWAGALPAQPGALPLALDPNHDRPKESNGGNGRWPAATVPAPKPEAKKGGAAEKEPDKKEPDKK